jgi:hypothetical protein
MAAVSAKQCDGKPGLPVRAPWKGRRGCSTLAAMIDFFRDLEERLLRAEVRRSPDEAGKLLASDFIEFGSSGAVYRRQQILDALAKESPMELSATDFSVRVLCDDVVLVTYRSARNDPASGQEWHSLRCSIWKFLDGRWLMSFHQGTPTRRSL